MERRFQYYVAFANHTEPGPGPGSIIIRWKNLYKLLRIFFMSLSTNYVLTHIYIEDMRTKKAL